MVLDEPTSQLDAVGAGLVFDALETLRARGVTVVLFEHRLERPARYADRVLVLDEGRIVADGPPADVLTDPRLAQWGWPHCATRRPPAAPPNAACGRRTVRCP